MSDASTKRKRTGPGDGDSGDAGKLGDDASPGSASGSGDSSGSGGGGSADSTGSAEGSGSGSEPGELSGERENNVAGESDGVRILGIETDDSGPRTSDGGSDSRPRGRGRPRKSGGSGRGDGNTDNAGSGRSRAETSRRATVRVAQAQPNPVKLGDLLALDDEKDDTPAKRKEELDDFKDGLAFLFDLPTLFLGEGHGHWRLKESELSKLSERGRRAYKAITKGKKSALVKAVEKQFPIIFFVALLLMILGPRIRESRQVKKINARLNPQQNNAARTNVGINPNQATRSAATQKPRPNDSVPTQSVDDVARDDFRDTDRGTFPGVPLENGGILY